jgi:hypothetical protein
MTEERTTRDELNEAKEQMKQALRSTLLAMRGALDAALNMLDGEPEQTKASERKAKSGSEAESAANAGTDPVEHEIV